MEEKISQELKPEMKIIYSNKYLTLFTIFSFLSFFAIIFTIIFLIIFRLVPYSFHGHNIDEFSNDYCQNKTNQYYELLCTNKYYKYNFKKSKFIWILTDGTASDQLTLLSNHEKYKITSSFLVEGDDVTYKHTNEIHEALITGRINRNYDGKEINFDNIIKQLVNAGYKINYRGWGLPIPDIVGDKRNGINENKIFNKKFIDNNHEITAFSSFCNITNPFPFLNLSYDKYQNPTPNNVVNDEILKKIQDIIDKKYLYFYYKESKLELYEELDELFEKNPIDLFTINIDDCLKKSFDWNENEDISILYYSTEVDHFNHCFGKAHIYNVLQMYITEKMIERIIKWIDDHEDYVLIVTSDHGGQEFFGEDALRNHGEDNPGNEAIFFIYSKELKNHYDELKMRERYIHITDEGEMIAQILSNINIPIYSRGFPLKLIKDDINSFISLKMKEIQLITLMEKYIEKYQGYENDLKDYLDGLQTNFSKTNYIINEFIGEDLKIKSEREEDFKKMIKENENSLRLTQEDIINIIKSKNKATGNIVLFVVIFIFIFVKFFFEIYIIFFRVFDLKNAEIKKRKLYISILTIFIILFIFFYYTFILGDNLRNCILNYCFFIGCYISILLFYFGYFFFRQTNKNKANLLICSILLFSIFVEVISYSDCFYYLKKNLLYFSKLSNSFNNLITFFFLILIIIILEQEKFLQKKYFFYIFRKTIYVGFTYILYMLFAITIFIEDCTRKDYYEQNLANKIFVCINFVIFIFLFIISNFSVYEATNKEERNINNDIRDIEVFKADEKSSTDLSNKNNDDITDKNKFLIKKRVDGLPLIKLFLLLLFFWISDEGQKLFGLVILLPFLEILSYLSDYFNSKIDEIIHKKQKNNFDSTNSELNSINDASTDRKNSNKNLYIFYFIYYLMIQEMFIIGNQSAFALLKNSFGLDSDKVQQVKVLYVLKFLSPIFGKVVRYRFSLIILGFYLEKNFYDKNGNNKDYSLGFILRKLILGLRIDLDILYIFYQMLININDRLFIDLYIYFFVNASLFVLDYIGFWINKLSKKIC